MNLLSTLLSGIFSLLLINSPGQPKSPIKNVYATYEVRLPGNIRLDSNGKEVPLRDTLFTVYVECSSKSIKWNAAWRNDKIYVLRSTIITETSFLAGKKEATNTDMIINISKGNVLWKLQLVPSDENFKAPLETKSNKILLKGKWNGNSFFKWANNLVQIKAIPSV
jgi:hypothetical protein